MPTGVIIIASRRLLSVTCMTRLGAVAAAVLLLVTCTSKAPKSLVTASKPPVTQKSAKNQQPVRGVWITTVSRLDWPPVGSIIASSPESRISQQKLALIAKLAVGFPHLAVVRHVDRQNWRKSRLRSAAVYAR